MFRERARGEVDRGGGVVWRAKDRKNYYIARYNPLEDNFRVYKVTDGKRAKEFQDAEVKIPAGEWHTLKVTMSGEKIECFLDGKKYLDVKDDASDNRIVECAVAAGSDVIVTGDKHLLALGSFRGIDIVRVSDFLGRVSRRGR